MQVILFSALAGICGTGLGGLILIIIGNRSTNTLCWMLSFAGGVMTSIVCFGLIPEAVGLSGISMTVAGVVMGIVVIMLLNYLVDAFTETRAEKRRIHHTHEELYHESPLISDQVSDQKNMLRSGTLMLVAIGLHNIPEGIAIGSGGSHDLQLGILLAVMIALHNIPEGMAIAAPLLAGGLNKSKIVCLTALSGAPTLLGGILGVLLGHISNAAVSLSLAGAGGAMLYVVFGEIIPQSVVMTKSRVSTLVTLFGIIIGLLMTQR